MKYLKRMLVAAVAVMMLVPMTAFAAGSPAKTSLSKASTSAKTLTYTGKDQKAKLTVKVGTTTLKEGKDFTVTGSTKGKKVGTYTVTIKGIGKYTGSKKITYKIEKAKVSDTKASVKALTYNGKNQTAKLTVKLGDLTLTEGKDFKVTGTTKAKKPGTYKLKITGKGSSFTGTKTVTYEIGKATQKVKVTGAKTVKASSLKKKGTTLQLKVTRKDKAKVTFKSSSKKIKVSSKGKVTLPKKLKKGTYKITVTVKSTKNYKAATKTISIKVK